MDRAATVAALSHVELFRGVGDVTLGHVADISSEWSIPLGQHVYFAGDLATEFYVVVTGRVRAFIPGYGEEMTVTIVEPGQLFGEMALLDGGPRAATAIAIEPTVLLEVDRARWLTLASEDPALTHRVLAALGASVRTYASHIVDFQFLDLEIPDVPPPPISDTA
ncbi:MAG TPA: cyclic nucleotide-binding domain-containing protein [Actinomycetota bacterium]|nr:cyclic nucleotide-binding domain-containing protein [Actinomycetota bacterium]